MAGINAHQYVNRLEDFVLDRSEAYIGVLIDDLITKGTDEPYRMFTSRAEYRILLRQDNADIRLTPLAHSIGIASNEELERVNKKIQGTETLKKQFRQIGITPEQINPVLTEKESSLITQQVKLTSIITRPHISLEDILNVSPEAKAAAASMESVHPEIVSQTEIQLKYEGYIEREEEQAAKLTRLEEVKIPKDIDFRQLKSLSSEAVEKLTKIQPATIGQASRISGVTPSDVSILLIYLGR
jgi:tRNA uridine 5-carboxymethylaminomethyl modification enzyme